MHVWLTSMSLFKMALTFWFSLTAFHLSKWDEIWHAYHAMCCDWSWFIWWFLEMFRIAFELSLAVDFYELLNAMFWLLLFIKWWWWLIWMWDHLDLFLIWLKLIYANFHVLFWIISPSLTLGLDLVVCLSCLSFDFRLKKHIALSEVVHSFGWIIWLILANLDLFCRLMLAHLSLSLCLAPCCIACLTMSVNCWLLTVCLTL